MYIQVRLPGKAHVNPLRTTWRACSAHPDEHAPFPEQASG